MTGIDCIHIRKSCDRFFRSFAILLAPLCLLLAGCTSHATSNRDSARDEAASPAASDVQPNLGIQSADRDDLKSWIRNSNSPYIVVDFWASWCGPCVEKFPKFVVLAGQYKALGIEAVYVSFDEPDEVDEIQEFMQERGAIGKAFVRKQKIIEAFEGFDLNSLPTYRLYDGQGNVVGSFDGVNAFESLSEALRTRFGQSE